MSNVDAAEKNCSKQNSEGTLTMQLTKMLFLDLVTLTKLEKQ